MLRIGYRVQLIPNISRRERESGLMEELTSDCLPFFAAYTITQLPSDFLESLVQLNVIVKTAVAYTGTWSQLRQ